MGRTVQPVKTDVCFVMCLSTWWCHQSHLRLALEIETAGMESWCSLSLHQVGKCKMMPLICVMGNVTSISLWVQWILGVRISELLWFLLYSYVCLGNWETLWKCLLEHSFKITWSHAVFRFISGDMQLHTGFSSCILEYLIWNRTYFVCMLYKCCPLLAPTVST